MLSLVATLSLIAASLLPSSLAMPLAKRGSMQTLVGADRVSQFSKYMQYASAAYCPAVFLNQTWTCGRPCRGVTAGTRVLVSFPSNDDAHGVGAVAVNDADKAIIVTFRGTATREDWIQNIKVGYIDDTWFESDYGLVAYRNPAAVSYVALKLPPDLKLHRGFYGEYDGIRERLQSALAKIANTDYPTYSVFFVGHSLGGVIASLAAVDFVAIHGTGVAPRTSIYTFGQPRAGNKAWALLVDSIPFKGVFRITRQRDPVVHLPTTWFTGYRHFSTEYGIDVANRTLTCTPSGDAGETDDCQSLNFVPDFGAHAAGYFGWEPAKRNCV
ncbi:Alpha/Beta hydrolase protein [Entophlyctis helioformis]|nr:Alpha/Beta hydrolase protein [Entophlyctis helioformis]